MKNMTYSDLMKLSVAERRYFLGKKIHESDKNKENAENGGVNSNGGKTRISGEALKAKLTNKEIPGVS